ncbi:MAG: aminoglycoside N(3)-acetyltransferase [Halobacteriales archaeon]
MGEKAAIDRVGNPVTVTSLVDDLQAFDLTDEVVLVHASLSSLGWVAGGPQAVVDALQSVVTESGTIVMPTFTGQYTDPAGWSNPPVPDHWVEQIREAMPPFRPAVTPSREMGTIPECFRTFPDVRRSRHPEFSFAAWGADANAIVEDHSFDDGLGEGSPLARLYEREAKVLLMGVGYDVNTSFHLAEYRAEIGAKTVSRSAPIQLDGQEQQVVYETIAIDTADFTDLGADFERDQGGDVGAVGATDVRLLDQRAMVDFAVEWFETHRTGPDS